MACQNEGESKMKFSGAKGEVKLMSVNPGHFHAALVHKKMYDLISPTSYIYAPETPDLLDHLNRVNGYNTRPANPTSWDLQTYKGTDFFEKMLSQRPGNVVLLAGNNEKKTSYIKGSVDAGINVLSDKPMCIDKKGFELLKQAFKSAEQHDVLLYDIMTERFEITTLLQKELAQSAEIFGTFEKGTADDPAVTKESVHHFFKYVSGNPIKRPGWYFDVRQQGEGIVDVSTHLVDLVMWGVFPGQIIDYSKDVNMLRAKRWPTLIDLEQYKKVTGLTEFPAFLQGDVDDKGVLNCFANGEMVIELKGIHAKISVVWNYQAPEGAGDTHYSIMRGTKANVVIRQGKEQSYRPELYVEVPQGGDSKNLGTALMDQLPALQSKYPGVAIEAEGNRWHVVIPAKYRVGHEAHFSQVTEKYLEYLVAGKLPDWEVPNMISKYYVTTAARELALQSTK
jgi:predicted dehydrogenase